LNYTADQLDALNELGNIGMGNAAVALSKMLGKRFSVSLPGTEVVAINKIADRLGGEEKPVVGICLQINGAFRGRIFMFFSSEKARELAALLLNSEMAGDGSLDEMAHSALKEMANVAVSNYLTALSTLLKKELLPSIPGMAEDMLEAIMDEMLSELSLTGEDALLIQVNFKIEERNIGGDCLLLLDDGGVRQILEALNM